MKILPIVWQRLMSAAGTTCSRCQGTHDEVQRAVERLKRAVEPLGITPVLQIRELDQAAFLSQPLDSNRIWIAGQPMEDWVEGRVGSSRCCEECGDQDCRTVEVGGTTYDVIPEELLVRAGLTAANRLLDPTLTS